MPGDQTREGPGCDPALPNDQLATDPPLSLVQRPAAEDVVSDEHAARVLRESWIHGGAA